MSTFNILLQFILPHHLISRFVGWLTRIRWRPFKNGFTRWFISVFEPDLSDAEVTDPFAYEHFNAFFTRALRAGTRPLAGDGRTLVSPVDGALGQAGPIDNGRLVQAKGRDYTLDALLAGAARQWSPPFSGGTFATIYLAPFNYHRIHMPCDGTLRSIWYVPGRLFSVNVTAARRVRDVFARNERLVLLFDGPPGPFAVIFVGALNVGSMATVWHGDVTPRRSRVVAELPLPPEQDRFRARGAEIGRFNMGSTVVLLFAPDALDLVPLASGQPLRLGEKLGEIRAQA